MRSCKDRVDSCSFFYFGSCHMTGHDFIKCDHETVEVVNPDMPIPLEVLNAIGEEVQVFCADMRDMNLSGIWVMLDRIIMLEAAVRKEYHGVITDDRAMCIRLKLVKLAAIAVFILSDLEAVVSTVRHDRT